jgi:N-methylhydantoinase A
VRAPAVDVASIGAGGGSIAYIAEATGALRVGPESAGAVPGPACYDGGGTAATVTDANVVLGHLPPRLLGGAMKLNVEAAHEAVGRVAEARGAGVEETARAIVDMVDEAMLGALRVVTVQRGRTPSDFALVAFGGAGGVHANALAKTLGSYPVIVPEESGVLSALGFISSDIKNEFSQTFVRSLASVTPDAVREPFESLTSRAREWLDAESVDAADQDVRFILDMRYARQGYEIPIELDGVELASLDLTALERRFGDAHRLLYGFVLDGGAEIVNLRVAAVGRVPMPEVEARPEGDADPSAARTGTQSVWTPDGTVDVPTYDRAALQPGMTISGYAIVEQYDATTVVLPDHRAVVDPWANLLIWPEEPNR